MTRWSWVLAFVCGSTGLLAGRTLAPRAADRTREPSRVERVIVRDGEGRTSTRLGEEDVRRVVREELLAALDDRCPVTAATVPAPEPAPPPPSVEQRVALDDALLVIDNAVASRRWTDADRDALNAAGERVAPDDRFELFRRLSAAINMQSLRIETSGPPL